jgi:hypothetical protein
MNIDNKLKIPPNSEDEVEYLANFGFAGSGGTGH